MSYYHTHTHSQTNSDWISQILFISLLLVSGYQQLWAWWMWPVDLLGLCKGCCSTSGWGIFSATNSIQTLDEYLISIFAMMMAYIILTTWIEKETWSPVHISHMAPKQRKVINAQKETFFELRLIISGRYKILLGH